MLLAFERLCRRCELLEPHPLYWAKYPTDEGVVIEVVEEALDEGPACRGGLRPLTSMGGDCPYFKGNEAAP